MCPLSSGMLSQILCRAQWVQVADDGSGGRYKGRHGKALPGGSDSVHIAVGHCAIVRGMMNTLLWMSWWRKWIWTGKDFCSWESKGSPLSCTGKATELLKCTLFFLQIADAALVLYEVCLHGIRSEVSLTYRWSLNLALSGVLLLCSSLWADRRQGYFAIHVSSGFPVRISYT